MNRDLKAEKIIKDSNKLDVSQLSGGMYIVKISTEAGTVVQRIIKR